MSRAFIDNYDTLVHAINIDAFKTVSFATPFVGGTYSEFFTSGYSADATGQFVGGTTYYFDDIFYFDNFGTNFLTYDLNQFIDITTNNLRLNFSDIILSDRNDYVDSRLVGQASSTINVTLDGTATIDFRGGIDHYYINDTFNNLTVNVSGSVTTLNGTPTKNLENVILNDGTFPLQQLTSRGSNDPSGNNSSDNSFGNFSHLVNETFYRSKNPDVAAAGVDPTAHYYSNGHLEGRDPNWWFDTSFYLANNADVASAQLASGLNPLEHFMTSGNLTRDPMSLFDTSFYLQTNPDVAAAGINPLIHYLENGWKETRSPYEGFSSSGYLQANPDVAAAGVNPLEHWLYHGQFENRPQFAIFNYSEFDFL